MNLTYSDEQEMIRSSVFDYFAADYTFEFFLERIQRTDFPDPAIWQNMAELGWLGFMVSEDHGGLGLGPQEAFLLMEGAGAALNIEPLLSTAIVAAPLLAQGADDAQVNSILTEVIAGQQTVALAWAEKPRGFAPTECATTATRDGAQGVALINGKKILVDNGAGAQWLIVSAVHEGELGLYLVAADSDGVSRTGTTLADGSHVADIVFTNAPASACLATGAQAKELLLQAVYRGLSATCGEALGAMDRILQICRQYLHERKQFGKPLAAQQVLQHRFVDMQIATERARSMAILTAIQADKAAAGDEQAQRDLSLAKYIIGQSARYVGGEGIQVHGGMGMAYEYPVGHYYRKLLCCDARFGSKDDHLSLLELPADIANQK
ncbi:MAG TPA: acyl-CoA dehydrogenase family protein [Paenalcaligenes sp.]|nr:acyl-CoA dehydrogenase family protein [Paenalcaligenes sp.]